MGLSKDELRSAVRDYASQQIRTVSFSAQVINGPAKDGLLQRDANAFDSMGAVLEELEVLAAEIEGGSDVP